MSSRRTLPVFQLATVVCGLLALCALFALSFARQAEAAYYKSVLCAANNGILGPGTDTNTRSSVYPNGIFSFENWCHPGSPYPGGNNNALRIRETPPDGAAGIGAFGRFYWHPPQGVSFAAAGGFTRMPGQFNDGWRGLFWMQGYDGSQNNVLVQGTGVANGSCGGVCWNTTPVFASHLWPFPNYGHYGGFVFEMHCFRGAGCDRAGENYFDANSFQLILNDLSPPSVAFTGSTPIMSGQWVRGTHTVTWDISEAGSGLRFERVRVDGGLQVLYDFRAGCNIDNNGATGEFARVFVPCPAGGPFHRSAPLDTATLADGVHTMQYCAQDYGQAQGLSGSGGESCTQRQIRTDNRSPAAPGGLAIETSSPARYVDRFGARWTLPADPGSPIAKVHYDIVDGAGKVVVAQKTVAASNPVKLDGIQGPEEVGDYRLRVWLEDSVGLSGPPASVPIPRDTKPPAAPQDLSVTSPETSRASQGFDVRWRNITDDGSPISEVHYQVLNGAGNVVVSTKAIKGENPQSILNLETPKDAGAYTLKMWLSDAEGNVGAPSTAPLSYRCMRSEQSGGTSLSAGLGAKGDRAITVQQGVGSGLVGSLTGPGAAIRGAAICVFSRVVTDAKRDFLGVAMTGPGGDYSFAIPAEASREITATYRGDQREVAASATIFTQVKPTFKVRKRVVKNKRAAVFSGEIPGPHNDKVVVVLQVKSGKGWRAFRRYRTRSNGRYLVRYRFTRTSTPTKYVMRAQVRAQVGYPYLQGNSKPLTVKVTP